MERPTCPDRYMISLSYFMDKTCFLEEAMVNRVEKTALSFCVEGEQLLDVRQHHRLMPEVHSIATMCLLNVRPGLICIIYEVQSPPHSSARSDFLNDRI